MNLAVLLIVILSSLKWGDWKNWQKYHSTMILAGYGNLLFQFLYCDNDPWLINPGFYQNHTIFELVFSVIILPFTAFLFLSNYPDSSIKKFLHFSYYISVYVGFEYLYFLTGNITYHYGWSFMYSVAWDIMMFTIWAVHFRKPIKAYILATIVVIIIAALFPVKCRL